MSQTTPPRGVLLAEVADAAPTLGAQAAGAERLARLPVASTRRPALLRWKIGWSRASAPGGDRARGRRNRVAELDAAHGPSKHRPSRYELCGMTVPTHDATLQDGGMVTTGEPRAGSMFPAT